MKKNLSFFILIAFLLIKHSLGEDETIENEDIPMDNGKVFRNAVLEKFAAISDEPIKLGIELVEETYADKSENENVNKLLTQILSDYEKYQKIRPEKLTSKIEMFLRLSYVFDFVSGPISDKLQNKDAILLVKAALEKHNFKSVIRELHKSYDQFLEWLIPEIAAYSNKLNTKEQLQVKEFKELCLQFKDETDLQKKLFVTNKIVMSLE